MNFNKNSNNITIKILSITLRILIQELLIPNHIAILGPLIHIVAIIQINSQRIPIPIPYRLNQIHIVQRNILIQMIMEQS